MTEPYKIIEVKESVFADNDREAARLRTQLKQDRTFLLNLMSSPGSGKTTSSPSSSTWAACATSMQA